MVNIMSTEDQEKQLDTDVVADAFSGVIYSFLQLLRNVAYTIANNYTENIKREKRQFRDVKRELFIYLLAHKHFYQLKSIKLQSMNGSVLFEININYLETSENFLKLEDVLRYNTISNENKLDSETEFEYDQEDEKIIETIQKVQGKTGLINKDVLQFLENNYLVDRHNINTKCSNYTELQAFVEDRIESFCNEKLSEIQINDMSSKFQGLVKEFNGEE